MAVLIRGLFIRVGELNVSEGVGSVEIWVGVVIGDCKLGLFLCRCYSGFLGCGMSSMGGS